MINTDFHLRRRSGFTLFELVVAMAMVAVLAGTFYSTLQICFRATEDATSNLEPPRTAQLALDFLGDDLRNSLAPTGTLANAFTGTLDQGDTGEADDIIFFTTADGPLRSDGNGEIKTVELTLQTMDNNEHVLTRSVLPAVPQETENREPTVEIICRNVVSFTVTYFNGTSWFTSWDSTEEDNTLPTAVRVVLVLERPAPRGSSEPMQYRFTRTYLLSCSTAAQDANLTDDASGDADPSADGTN